jgi:hypothetical protein
MPNLLELRLLHSWVDIASFSWNACWAEDGSSNVIGPTYSSADITHLVLLNVAGEPASYIAYRLATLFIIYSVYIIIYSICLHFKWLPTFLY